MQLQGISFFRPERFLKMVHADLMAFCNSKEIHSCSPHDVHGNSQCKANNPWCFYCLQNFGSLRGKKPKAKKFITIIKLPSFMIQGLESTKTSTALLEQELRRRNWKCFFGGEKQSLVSRQVKKNRPENCGNETSVPWTDEDVGARSRCRGTNNARCSECRWWSGCRAK